MDCLRIIRDFFGVVFKIEELIEKKEEFEAEKEKEINEVNENKSDSLESDIPSLCSKIMSFKCLGIGLINLARNTN